VKSPCTSGFAGVVRPGQEPPELLRAGQLVVQGVALPGRDRIGLVVGDAAGAGGTSL